jgi:type I restriction enzyme S subunit
MVEDVTRDGKFVTPQTDFLTEKGAQKSRSCDKGTLTIVCSGTVGIPSFLAVDACIHDGFLALPGIRPDICDDFLYHQIDNLTDLFGQSATHGGIFTNLTTEILKNFKLPLPPTFKEQRAIADALSNVDDLITDLDKLIDKKKKVKKGAIQALITGNRRLPGFSGEWDEKRLGDVATFRKGSGLPKKELTFEGEHECIHYGQLFTHYDHCIEEIKSRTENAGGRVFSRSNDVLMPTSCETPEDLATASCVEQEGVILGGDILVIGIPDDINGTFLSYCITHDKKQVMQFVSGTTVYHIYASEMADFEFKLPTLEEQNAILEVLSDLDSEIEALQSKREKYTKIKQGMMQKLLTGEIRLV